MMLCSAATRKAAYFASLQEGRKGNIRIPKWKGRKQTVKKRGITEILAGRK